MLGIWPLASSSEANTTLIFDDDMMFLIDAGMGVRALTKKLENYFKMRPIDISNVLITHEHTDHIKSVGAIWNKFHPQVWVNQVSMEKKANYFSKIPKPVNMVSSVLTWDGTYVGTSNMAAGNVIGITNFEIEPFSTKHDSVSSVGFVITHKPSGYKIGYITDTGAMTKLMYKKLEGVETLFIEADYDEESLNNYDDYDEFLKDRIKSNFGHLSNKQMTEAVNKIGIDVLDNLIIGHLSPRTNTPEKVREEIEKNIGNGWEIKAIIAPIENPIILLE